MHAGGVIEARSLTTDLRSTSAHPEMPTFAPTQTKRRCSSFGFAVDGVYGKEPPPRCVAVWLAVRSRPRPSRRRGFPGIGAGAVSKIRVARSSFVERHVRSTEPTRNSRLRQRRAAGRGRIAVRAGRRERVAGRLDRLADKAGHEAGPTAIEGRSLLEPEVR